MWFGFFWETSSGLVSLFCALLGTTVAVCSYVGLVGFGTFRGFCAKVDLGAEFDALLPQNTCNFYDFLGDYFRKMLAYSAAYACLWIQAHASDYATKLLQNFTQFLHEGGLGETTLDVPLTSGSHCSVAVSLEEYRTSGFLGDDFSALSVFNANSGFDSGNTLAAVTEAVWTNFPRFSRRRFTL